MENYTLEPKEDMTVLELLELIKWTFGYNIQDPTKVAVINCPQKNYNNLSDGLKRHFMKVEMNEFRKINI